MGKLLIPSEHPDAMSLLGPGGVGPATDGDGAVGLFPMDGSSWQTEGKKGLSPNGDGLNGVSFRELGPFILQRLLEVSICFPLRSQSTGNGRLRDVFPLPTSREILRDVGNLSSPQATSWLISLCIGLNSLWGGPLMFDGEPNSVQREALTLLSRDVARVCNLAGTLEDFDWGSFFDTRSIDYKGDEVKTARQFCWNNIGPALPKEIGQVRLEDVCELGCRHYVLHFDDFLKPPDQWIVCKPPRVMVSDDDWPQVCSGLVQSGLCTFLEEDDIFHVEGKPLLNGMFGVTKDEWADDYEVFRLIMNLIPLNQLCQPLAGDVDTLPSWSLMNPFFLQPNQQLVVSSEDVRCFFYTLAVPRAWWKYMAFNKLVPDSVLPEHLQGGKVYLASCVLPMGFLNSVSLAQHVHRCLVLRGGKKVESDLVNKSHLELRKDRPFPEGDPLWRVYLDNYDLLEKVEKSGVVDVLGTVSPSVDSLLNEYQEWGVPRNVKKSVSRSLSCEVQGAQVDGVAGIAYPRESKLLKYVSAALKVCSQSMVTQKQLQVVCGGLVYFSMFRRQLLGGLNAVWTFIESFNSTRKFKLRLPDPCRLEILRFIALIPLARIDFRLPMQGLVTCSDASSTGGGICSSGGLTTLGHLASQGELRGEQVSKGEKLPVLSIGLFDGIGALRVALDLLSCTVIGHISVEKSSMASRVVENHFPGTVFVDDVAEVNEELVKSWALKYSGAVLVLLGAGPPCQGVSGLNADRKGALKDLRSCLFSHVPRVRDLLRRHFPWAQVHSFMESVASMDQKDCAIMSDSSEACLGSAMLELYAGAADHACTGCRGSSLNPRALPLNRLPLTRVESLSSSSKDSWP